MNKDIKVGIVIPLFNGEKSVASEKHFIPIKD